MPAVNTTTRITQSNETEDPITVVTDSGVNGSDAAVFQRSAGMITTTKYFTAADVAAIWQFHVVSGLFIIWMVGVAKNLVGLVRHWLHAKQMQWRLISVVSGPVYDRLIEHCRHMGVNRQPELRTSQIATTPFLIGISRPMIVLPVNLAYSGSCDELDAVLTHELAHVQRRDLLWNWLPALAEAVFFFHPLVWLARREWRLSQEIATDEHAITASKLDVARYASAIVELVSKSPRASTNPHFTIALSEAYTQLARRMTAMQTIPCQPRRRTAIAGMIAVLACIGIVPWTVTAQPPVEPQTQVRSPAAVVAEENPATETIESKTPTRNDTEPKPVTHPISVSGRALDTDGNPIAGATMYLSSLRADWKRLAETVTDPKGRYQFRDIPLPLDVEGTFGSRVYGVFEIFGVAPGHGFGWRPEKFYFPNRSSNFSCYHRDLTDAPLRFFEDDPIELDVMFRTEAHLTGIIVDDTGNPIADARVAIRACWPEGSDETPAVGQLKFGSLNGNKLVPPEVRVRQTDEDGRFEFTGLPADCRFRIDVRPRGFPSRWIEATTKSDSASTDKDRNVLSDGMVLQFARPNDVTLRVVFDDTGEPAAKVLVSAAGAEGNSGGATGEDGKVNLRLSEGKYKLELLPRIGEPYLVTDLQLTWSAENRHLPIEFRLRRAAVVEVSVVDESTGAGIADVDLWCSSRVLEDLPPARNRELHDFRSYELETRICHVERPRTDAMGTLKANFEPGAYRIGVGLNSFPFKDYRNTSGDGQPVVLRSGETTKLTFKVRRHGINKDY